MLIEQYTKWFDDVIGGTRQMYALVKPEHLDWKPTQHSFTVGQLLEHMPRAFWFNAKVMAQTDLPLKSVREILVANRRQQSVTVEEGLAHLNEYSAQFRNAVTSLGDDRFERETITTPQWGTIARWRFAVFVLEHHLNHKMELHMNLRLLNAGVNTKTLYTDITRE